MASFFADHRPCYPASGPSALAFASGTRIIPSGHSLALRCHQPSTRTRGQTEIGGLGERCGGWTAVGAEHAGVAHRNSNLGAVGIGGAGDGGVQSGEPLKSPRLRVGIFGFFTPVPCDSMACEGELCKLFSAGRRLRRDFSGLRSWREFLSPLLLRRRDLDMLDARNACYGLDSPGVVELRANQYRCWRFGCYIQVGCRCYCKVL